MISASQWVLIIGGILSAAAGGIFLKLGAQELSHDQQIGYVVWSAIMNYKLVLGLSFYVWPSFIWIYLLKELDLSLLQPITSLMYVVTPAFAVLLLGEHISLLRGVGILIILVGVFFISRS
jgi:drug/metabolite transporter (DMT)-like permease